MTYGDSRTGFVLRTLHRDHAKGAGLFWVVLFALFGVLEAAVVAFGTVEHSIWEFAAVTTAKYVPLAVCALVVLLRTRLFVANGVTRRDFTLGALGFAGVYVAAFALLLTLGNLAEYAVFSARDLPTTVNAPHLYENTGQVVPAFVGYLLVLAAYAVCGLLVGAGYQRFGGVLGTLFVLPAVLPVLVAESALATGWAPPFAGGLGLDALPPWLGAGLSLVAVLAGGAALLPLLGRAVVGTSTVRPVRDKAAPAEAG